MPVFENPAAFLFLLFIPGLYICRKLNVFRKIAFPLTFSDWEGKSFVWEGKISKIINVIATIISNLGFIMLVIAFSKPIIHQQERIYTSKGADILFVLDTSPSMASKDIAGMSRLEAAKMGIRTLVNSNKGASFGLISMASEAAAIVPPTVDHNLFIERLDSLYIGGLGDGSAIGIGLSSAIYHLMASSAPKKCIVLITDGENNAGAVHPDTAAILAKENNITLYIFGIGTKGTVPIEYIEPTTGKVYSGFYESEFDTTALEAIASVANGRFFGIESTSALSDALATISRKESVTQTFHYKSMNTKLYTTFLFLAGVLFCFVWFMRRVILKEIV